MNNEHVWLNYELSVNAGLEMEEYKLLLLWHRKVINGSWHVSLSCITDSTSGDFNMWCKVNRMENVCWLQVRSLTAQSQVVMSQNVKPYARLITRCLSQYHFTCHMHNKKTSASAFLLCAPLAHNVAAKVLLKLT